ncbi:uncharacterized protein ARMOST_14419 [Armillaria ostoyae]|uniref:Uncharacterized protein n=1 Tax=Armillaria ostoyae TaxID=47428 RepID=A0A284RQH2_ARMOS|nr:uncharacterized protein ARMOST_14419 [Armillaria ostoyae]
MLVPSRLRHRCPEREVKISRLSSPDRGILILPSAARLFTGGGAVLPCERERHSCGHGPSAAKRPAVVDSIVVHRICAQVQDSAAEGRRATVLVNWNDVFAVALDTKHTKLWIAGEKGMKEVVLLTERMLGEYAGNSTGCVHARIEYDPVHEMDVVNVFKVQKAAGQAPLSLNRRVKPTFSSLALWSKTDRHPYGGF